MLSNFGETLIDLSMDEIAFLTAVIDHAIDGIMIADADGVITIANPSASRLFGYRHDELIGKRLQNLISGIRGDEIIPGKERETLGVRSNQESFAMRLAVSEATNKDNTVYVLIIQDLTIEKLAEQALLKNKDQLEAIVTERTQALETLIAELEMAKEEVTRSLLNEQEISRLKSRFVSMASHEFRSPLSSIQLSAALIERYYDRLDKAKIMLHVKKIRSSVADLTNTLEDFLSVEKIESGKVKLAPSNFQLNYFIKDLCDELSLMKKPLQNIFYNHKGPGDECICDKNLVRHCLVNLLSNAIKYSPVDGLIEVKSHIDDCGVTIHIRDNGPGVPEESRERLFEAFFRADNVRDIPGTGLGLHIVKKYAELMNGSITYGTPPTGGSEFVLSFPVGIEL